MLSENVYEGGEDKTTAIDLAGMSVYILGSEPTDDVWFMLQAASDGIVEASTDVPYSGSYTVEMGKSTDSYLSQIVQTVGGQTVYKGSTPVKTGDIVYLHLALNGDVLEGKTVSLLIRDYEMGEDVSMPIELEDGATVSIGNASYDSPRWFKMTLKNVESYTLSATNYIGGTLYQGLANAQAGSNPEYPYFTCDYSTGIYSYTVSKPADGEVYFAIDFNYSNATLSLSIKQDATTIETIEAVVSQDDSYYTLQGVKVDRPTKGIYIHNGRKVVVK